MENRNIQNVKKVSGLFVQILPWFIGAIALLSIFFTKPSEILTPVIVGFFTLILMVANYTKNNFDCFDQWFKVASIERGYKQIPQPLRIYAIVAVGVILISQALLNIIRGVIHEGLKYMQIHDMLILLTLAGFGIVYVGLRLEAYGKVTEKWILKLPPDEEELGALK